MKKKNLFISVALMTLCVGCVKKEAVQDNQTPAVGNMNLNNPPALPATAQQFLGVTCGFQYSAQLTGPVSSPSNQNISLYNPDPANPNATWDGCVEQLAQAGVDFVCPNLTGSQPNTNGSPTKITPLITSINNRGL